MQMGFVHESKYCTGCKACQVACKDKRDGAVGENFRRVSAFEGGGYVKRGFGYESSVYAYYISVSCNHCADPKCVENCPSGAMKKDGATGIVTVDRETCIGCGCCAWSCPYGAPRMDREKGVMGKCDFCWDLLAKGEPPACVAACPLHLLHCGDMKELRERHEVRGRLAAMPEEALTRPSLIVVPHKDAL